MPSKEKAQKEKRLLDKTYPIFFENRWWLRLFLSFEPLVGEAFSLAKENDYLAESRGVATCALKKALRHG